MTSRPRSAGLTLADLAATLAAIALLLCATLPVLAGLRGDAGIQQSMANLIHMAVAHVLYAADWNGRQVCWTADDLGAYASLRSYNSDNGCRFYDFTNPSCHPPMLAGWDCIGSLWGYWPDHSNNVVIEPIVFPPSPATGFGHFRVPNARPFHFYLTGRYHDPVYYAPKDTTILEHVQDCLDVPCEFGGSSRDGFGTPQCNPGWSSYCFSAATRLHPDVMRANAAGGWQDPWSLDHGFATPGFFQATYPSLKTLMLEHNWLQGPPAECNPAFVGCAPYYFNHGIDSAPVTLFYDGSVRLLPNAEVLAADTQVLTDTGGVDGLWHRGTPFSADGYFIPQGYDGTPLSHHILTTDGILGRDTLSDMGPIPRARGTLIRKGPRPQVASLSRIEISSPRFTVQGGQP